jgi:preprotein translocase subunit SecF
MLASFNTGLTLWRAVPPLWVYGGLAMLGAAYALLIGVVAVAYRTYNAPRF